MQHDRLELPNRQLVITQQVLTGVALLEIGAFTDLEAAGTILKHARALKNHGKVKKAPYGACFILVKSGLYLHNTEQSILLSKQLEGEYGLVLPFLKSGYKDY